MMKYRSRWAAFLLSFFQCGVAQLYNGQPLKAIAVFCVLWVSYLLVYYLGTVTSFHGFLGVLCCAIVLFLFVMVDAIYNAGRVVTLRWYNRWYVYVLPSVIVFVVSLALDLTGFQYLHNLGTQSFKMPSASMIPTLVVGDRFVADFRPSARNVVHRGDLIVFKEPHDLSHTFIKRAMGLPGDRIRTEGSDVYVNEVKLVHTVLESTPGRTIVDETLGDVHFRIQLSSDRSYSDREYVVPDGQLFVMGDNRDNSADSREWGSVPLENVKGKPIYIYWSPDHSRIGQSLLNN